MLSKHGEGVNNQASVTLIFAIALRFSQCPPLIPSRWNEQVQRLVRESSLSMANHLVEKENTLARNSGHILAEPGK